MTRKSAHSTERAVYTPQTEANWRIPSEEGDYFLFRDLASAGTQEELAKVAGVQSLPVYFKVFGAMYNLRNSGAEIQKARQFVRDKIRTQFPSTLTTPVYMPEGQKDIIIHDYSTRHQKNRLIDFVGEDGEIQNVLDMRTCMALTGKKPEVVKEIMDWLNGTSYTGLWRVNSKPAQRDERVAWFFAGSDRAYLGCYRNTFDRCPAFRVSLASTEGASITGNKQGPQKS